jgi:DNA polymerase-3 subunit delta
VPARPVRLEDLPDPLPGVVLLVGDEELLVDRAVHAITAAARRADPTTVDVERDGGQIEGPELHELLGPSLFGDARTVVIRSGQDIRTAALAVLTPYLQEPVEHTTIVLHHVGAAKGKAVLQVVRTARALEIGCAKLTRSEERADFVRSEIARAGGRATPDAVAAIVDAVGSDLRELAAVAAQLVSDSGGPVDVNLVRAYHKGRAEVSGFAVSDLAMVGDIGGAMQALRYALGVGVPHVVIADAMADGVRSIARVSTAGRGDPFALARELGMPPWKVKRAQGQARAWSEPGVRRALGVVAGLNADVKGAAVDPSFAIEQAVRALAAARAERP